MSDRFTRDYKLTIGIGSKQVIIEPPFNISFSAVESSINKSLNKLNIDIPGLQESTRLKLIKYVLDKSTYLPIKLEVGYKGKLYRAFKGSVRTGIQTREGAIYINKLECYDGHPDYTQAFTSKVAVGTKQSIDIILEDMPNTQKGTITDLKETNRPRVLVGSSSHLLSTIAEGKEFYIKDEKIYMLGSNEVLSKSAPLVEASTGLISPPEQDHVDTTFTTMLNPTLKIGHLCQLKSESNPNASGSYRIFEITTNGTYKGNWQQIVTCRKANNIKVIR